MKPSQIINRLPDLLGDALLSHTHVLGEVTCEIDPVRIKEVCVKLRDDDGLRFATLTDLCGIDYSSWGAEGGKARQGGSP